MNHAQRQRFDELFESVVAELPDGIRDLLDEVAVMVPPTIMLFRVGIVAEAGGWDQPDALERIREEIRITLLHEIGHQFGLDEDDLARLGYE